MRSRADSRVELSFWFRALARASSRSASRLAASSSWIRRGASTSRRRNSLTSASRAARAASRPAWSSRPPSCGASSFRSESSTLVSSAATLPAPTRALRLPGDTQMKDVPCHRLPGGASTLRSRHGRPRRIGSGRLGEYGLKTPVLAVATTGVSPSHERGFLSDEGLD